MRKVTEDYIGTCQACFGEFKVGDDKLVVLHGYKRPGDGYTIGNCSGYDHAPFEYDTALTVKIIAAHRVTAAGSAERQRRLEAGEIVTLVRFWEEYDRTTNRTVQRSEKIAPGNERWDWTLKCAITNCAETVIYHTRIADYLQGKVDTWTRGSIVGFDTPLTGKERGLRKAHDPAEADAAEARAAEKAKRDAKPGKLKLIFYQPSAPRDPNGYHGNEVMWRAWIDAKRAQEEAFTAGIRQWAKANITGKTLVRQEVGDYELPSAIRGNGDFDVVTVSLPWEYRDEITTMFSSAQPYLDEPKKRSFTIAGTARPH